MFPSCSQYAQYTTGVDLSKILGRQTKILGGQKVVKSDKCMDVSQLLGHVPGLPPKSTPMFKTQLFPSDITWFNNKVNCSNKSICQSFTSIQIQSIIAV